MRMKLYFTSENEKMPIDYRRSIISFIKLSLSEYSENEFKKYYNQKDNIIKPYAFSVFFRKLAMSFKCLVSTLSKRYFISSFFHICTPIMLQIS